MESGLLLRWGKVIPGREEQALALFGDTHAYHEELKNEGKITHYESFLYGTADFSEQHGFTILKGPAQEIFAIMESDTFKDFTTKATLLLDHFTMEMLTVGDEVLRELDRYAKKRAELHI